jgi:hypothetical protein
MSWWHRTDGTRRGLGDYPRVVEPCAPGADQNQQRRSPEADMTHWHDTMVDRPETDGAVYATGWTISGLAVLGAIVAVWVLGI